MNTILIQHNIGESVRRSPITRFGQSSSPLMIRLQKKLEADQTELAKQNPQKMLQQVFLQVPTVGDITGQDLLVLVNQLSEEQRQKKAIAQAKRSLFQRIKDRIINRFKPFPEPQGVPIEEMMGYFHTSETHAIELALRDMKRLQLVEQSIQLPFRKAKHKINYIRLTDQGRAQLSDGAQQAFFKKRQALERRLKQWFEHFSEHLRNRPNSSTTQEEIVKELLLRSKIKTATGDFSYGDILYAIDQMSEKKGASQGRVMQYFQRNLEEEIQMEKALLKLEHLHYISKKEAPIKRGIPIQSVFYQVTPKGHTALEMIAKEVGAA